MLGKFLITIINF